jgi:hypothetical protein
MLTITIDILPGGYAPLRRTIAGTGGTGLGGKRVLERAPRIRLLHQNSANEILGALDQGFACPPGFGKTNPWTIGSRIRLLQWACESLGVWRRRR